MGFPPGDFKSPASAIPPPGLISVVAPLLPPPRPPGPPRGSAFLGLRAHRRGGLDRLADAAHVVLVLDLAHELLDDVLERDQPDGVTRRVHHDRHLAADLPE